MDQGNCLLVIMIQHSTKTKVNEGGRIVIPAKMRKALGIEVGKNVTLTLKTDSLEITTREKAFKRIEEMMKPHIKPSRSVVDELINERREEAKNE
jgi:AbrB family looped-hinge helix DNA binding protein